MAETTIRPLESQDLPDAARLLQWVCDNDVARGPGTVTYTHNGSETTTDSFTYTVSDAAGATSTAKIRKNMRAFTPPRKRMPIAITVITANAPKSGSRSNKIGRAHV